MPGHAHVYFLQEKKQWRQIFLVKLQSALTDETAQDEALKNRQAIYRIDPVSKQQTVVSEQFNTVLSAINDANREYYVDERIKASLLSIGFSKDEIDDMPCSLMVIVDSVVHDSVPAFEMANSYTTAHDPEEAQLDKEAFEAELKQLSKPFIVAYREFYTESNSKQRIMPKARLDQVLQASPGLRLLGLALMLIGVVLFVTPIPVLPQLLGGWLIVLSVSALIGGAGIFAAGSHQHPLAAKSLYDEQCPPNQGSVLKPLDSTASCLNGLMKRPIETTVSVDKLDSNVADEGASPLSLINSGRVINSVDENQEDDKPNQQPCKQEIKEENKEDAFRCCIPGYSG